jgi:hypothetical protein
MKTTNPFLAGILMLAGAFSALGASPILPDPRLTPGDFLTNVPVETILRVGYTAGYWRNGTNWVSKKDHRKGDVPVRQVTEKSHRECFARYGMLAIYNDPKKRSHYEDDHVGSLELGGSNSISNRFPQSYVIYRWNAHAKDRLENKMRDLLRLELAEHGHDAATSMLHQFQHEICTNWVSAFKQRVAPTP